MIIDRGQEKWEGQWEGGAWDSGLETLGTWFCAPSKANQLSTACIIISNRVFKSLRYLLSHQKGVLVLGST